MQKNTLSTNDLAIILGISKTYLLLFLKKEKGKNFFCKRNNRITVNLEKMLIELKLNKFEFEFEKNKDETFEKRLLIRNIEIVSKLENLTTREIKKYIKDVPYHKLNKLRKEGILNSKSSTLKYFEVQENKLDEYSVFPTKQFISYKEFREINHMSNYMLKKRIANNEIPVIKIGTVPKIPIVEYEKMKLKY